MKRLIVFPGFLDGVFCKNEMPFIISNFDDVIYFTYSGNIDKYNEIAKKHNIKYKVINNFEIENLIKIFIFLSQNWKDINEEMLLVFHKSGSLLEKLKRIVYMLLYVSFAVNADVEYSKISDKRYNDIVYSFWFSRGAFACSYLKLKYKLKGGFSRAHGYDLYEERNDVNYLPFRIFIIKHLNKIFPCSINGVEYLWKTYPQIKNKFECSYLGTENHGISAPSIDGKFRLVTCSSIIPVKRVNILARALKVIDKGCMGDKFEWICFGDGPLLKEIKEYTTNFKKVTVKFMGKRENEFIMDYYRNNNIDLFINTSSSEGLPVSIMEAISFGIPVMATDVGGSREIVQNSVTGILLKSDISAHELAIAIIDYYKNGNLNRDEIRKYWEKHFVANKNYGFLFKVIGL